MKDTAPLRTARRTYRLPDASASDAACARFGARVYARAAYAIAGARALPEGTEIFVCAAADAARAERLRDLLVGPGGVAAVLDCAVVGAEVLVECAGSPVALFAYVDAYESALGRVRRRALLPLHDATLVAVAAFAWNDPKLDLERILEVAADRAPW